MPKRPPIPVPAPKLPSVYTMKMDLLSKRIFGEPTLPSTQGSRRVVAEFARMPDDENQVSVQFLYI